MERSDGRSYNELRKITFEHDVAPHSTGSVLIGFGNTRVICSAMVEDEVPRWMRAQNVLGGWLTAEYNMLPYSTLDRKQRDSTRGKQDGRSVEIQRLIGRALRAVVDLKAMGPRTLWVDCDVLQADGGTRTAAITGGCVAAAIAFSRLVAAGKLEKSPIKQFVAAVSAGVVGGTPLLDLCYVEDRDADVDFNFVMTDKGEFVELQGSGEEAVFTQNQMMEMLDLAKKGVSELVELQRAAIRASGDQADGSSLKDLSDHFSN